MPRGQKKEIHYEGKALKIYEQIVQTEEKLKNLKIDLKVAYKEQVMAKKKAEKEFAEKDQKKILNAIKKSGKSTDEILSLLGVSIMEGNKEVTSSQENIELSENDELSKTQ